MRIRLLLLVGLFCLPALGQTPAYVQGHSCANTFTAPGHGNTHNGLSSFTCRLPDAAKGGTANPIIWFGQSADTAATVTVTDDKSDTFTCFSEDDATNTRVGLACEASTVTAGARSITVSYGGVFRLFNSSFVAEFENATYDTNCHSHGTGTTMSSGSCTPVGTGDMLVTYGVNDTDYTVTSLTPTAHASITWTPLIQDVAIGNTATIGGCCSMAHENAISVQYGIYSSASAITPQVTQAGGSTNGYIAMTLALKPQAGGIPPTSGIRVQTIEDEMLQNNSASPIALKFPCSGNLVVAIFNGAPSDYPSAISDTANGSWTSAGTPFNLAGHNSAAMLYKSSPTCSSTLAISYTPAQNPTNTYGDNVLFYDIVGAVASSPLGAYQTNTGNQGTFGNLSAISITPNTTSSLIIAGQQNDVGASNGVTTGNFDALNAGNQSDDSSGDTGNDFADENGGWMHYNSSAASSFTVTWIPLNVTGISYSVWGDVAASFNAAVVGFSYSPNPVAFGGVNAGGNLPLTVTITNNGNTSLVIGTLSSNSGLYVISSDTCSSQTVTAGNHCTFNLIFSPLVAGQQNTTVTVPDNAGNPDTINATGTGVLISSNPIYGVAGMNLSEIGLY